MPATKLLSLFTSAVVAATAVAQDPTTPRLRLTLPAPQPATAPVDEPIVPVVPPPLNRSA
jgi:hypothetical protein